jgi:CRP-like cAMP-binding protein
MPRRLGTKLPGAAGSPESQQSTAGKAKKVPARAGRRQAALGRLVAAGAGGRMAERWWQAARRDERRDSEEGRVAVALKGWFGGRSKGSQQEYTIDDLIVLERYEEAAGRLRDKLKANPQDLHSHLKLAEVCTQLHEIDRAVDEYAFVADEYAQDGFYDKGIALLLKASKLAPGDASLRQRIEDQQREKSLDHVRVLAIEGLRQAGSQGDGTSALDLQRLWHNLAGSSLVQTMPGEQLKRLFAATHIQQLEAGALVAAEGSQEPFMLVLARGTIDVMVRLRPGAPANPAGTAGAAGAAASGDSAATGALSVRSFGPGDLVGESALLERGAWPADYWVREAMTALRLDREGLERCLVGNADPRGFLEQLRGQHHDRAVAASVQTLRGGA